jgi:hypothetical protein
VNDDHVPSGASVGGQGSYIDRMDADAFTALCERVIDAVSRDANAASIRMGHCSSEIEQRVRRIVKAGDLNNSETERQVELGIRITATALAVLGARPTTDDIRYLLRS